MILTRYTPNESEVEPLWLLCQVAEGSFSVYSRRGKTTLQINDYTGGMYDLPAWVALA